jgi:hypothetical protein
MPTMGSTAASDLRPALPVSVFFARATPKKD